MCSGLEGKVTCLSHARSFFSLLFPVERFYGVVILTHRGTDRWERERREEKIGVEYSETTIKLRSKAWYRPLVHDRHHNIISYMQS